MTRRMLFMRLLGLVGAGVFARQALALGGWKDCYTLKGCLWQGPFGSEVWGLISSTPNMWPRGWNIGGMTSTGSMIAVTTCTC